MSTKTTAAPTVDGRPRFSGWTLVALGLTAGYLSGLFGVGGGIIVVPVLLIIGFSQRMAAGTSVAAILPTAIVGTIGYGIAGNIDWLAGLLLAAGVVIGAQLGTWLLARLPSILLFWIFLSFVVIVIVGLWLVIPSRDDSIDLTPWAMVGLGGAGIVVGVLSGLIGVGGGIIAVPALIFFFGASDLVAKGTSLLMMIPGSISATISNAIRKNVDIRVSAFIGITACVASPLGLLTAHAISPFWSNIAFSILMAGVSVQLLIKRARARRKPRKGSTDAKP